MRQRKDDCLGQFLLHRGRGIKLVVHWKLSHCMAWVTPVLSSPLSTNKVPLSPPQAPCLTFLSIPHSPESLWFLTLVFPASSIPFPCAFFIPSHTEGNQLPAWCPTYARQMGLSSPFCLLLLLPAGSCCQHPHLALSLHLCGELRWARPLSVPVHAQCSQLREQAVSQMDQNPPLCLQQKCIRVFSK